MVDLLYLLFVACAGAPPLAHARFAATELECCLRVCFGAVRASFFLLCCTTQVLRRWVESILKCEKSATTGARRDERTMLPSILQCLIHSPILHRPIWSMHGCRSSAKTRRKAMRSPKGGRKQEGPVSPRCVRLPVFVQSVLLQGAVCSLFGSGGAWPSTERRPGLGCIRGPVCAWKYSFGCR